jgi:hypothetical protein
MPDSEFLSAGSDIASAVDFLNRWYGDSPRQLVSIIPDGAIHSKCLWPQNPAELSEWLRREVAARRNCYYHVNQPGWALDKRAQKKDIRTVRALQLDIDPRQEETPEQCKERALAALAKHEPPPSVIVDSGNGVQALWLLDEPITLDGTPEAWERVEAYNVALQRQYDADSCFNVDRILRVPGTLNVPNKKKRSKGRTIMPSRLVEGMTNWARHPLSAFTPAPQLQQAGSTTARRGKVEIRGNLPRFASPDDLPVKLQDYTVMLMVNGEDPEDPTKYPSRSEVLWRVLCDMVRAGADDDTIAAVVLDPDFKISASVLDKARPEAYAAEQIAAAREEAINPALRELNARHAVIESDRGGRCVVAEEDWDDVMGRWHIKYQSFDAFRNRYMHRPIEIGRDKSGNPITMPMGKWWLSQEHRRQYRKIVFWPNREVPPDQYNLWRGFGCDARPGDGHEGFLRHVRENLCGGDQQLFDYVVNWLARMVQKPDQPGEVALVIRGEKGTGKGFFFRTLGSLFGQHFMQVSNPKFLVGDFNAHLRDCVFLFADEAFFAGDKKHESILKALITEPTLTVEAKGIDAEPAPNFLHIGVASNEDWVVPASADERRYCVLHARPSRATERSQFDAIARQLADGGRENLLYFLRSRDLSNFDPRDVPWTAALEEQKMASLDPVAQYLWLLLDAGELPNNVRGRANFAFTHGGPGTYGLAEDARRRVPSIIREGERALWRGLKAIGAERENGPPRGWKFPALTEARRRFERTYCKLPWDSDVTEWQPVSGAATPF